MVSKILVDKKRILSFCEKNNYKYEDYIKAGIIQTYLRFTGEFLEHFEKNISVIDFINSVIAEPISDMDFPIDFKIGRESEYVLIQSKNQMITSEYIYSLASSCEIVLNQMFVKLTISDIELVSQQEAQKIYKLSSGDSLLYNHNRTWVDCFNDNVKKYPNNIAVVDKESSITYEELDDKSNNIANYLIEFDWKENSAVVVACKRRKEFIIAITAINKAGYAYVPIDPEYPDNIRDYIIENSGAKMVLNDEKIKNIIKISPKNQNINKSKPENIAYMIYTSGTTGNPKGVMISHKAVMSYGAWTIPFLKLDETKRNFLFSSFSFDASILDTLIPLMAGAAIYIADEKMRMNLEQMAEYINENNITGMSGCYALGRELIGRYDLNLEYALLGGEAFLQFKKVPYRLINGYGPTEFTVTSSVHEINQNKEYIPPIGKPAPGSIQIITDCFMKMVPFGIAGELCLIGDQMAIGYCNNKQATEEAFVNLDNGMRCYRTGDLVKYNKNNELEYLGRIDRQVKHRGFRIEPAQIESRALQYKGITECVVVLKSINDIKKLCIYYSSQDKIDKTDFQIFLSEGLASYMIPEAYVQLDTIPKTPNGKIDFRSLPEIKVQMNYAFYEKPKSRDEKYVCKKICEILNIDQIGLNDDFFEFGGDSLKCMELVQELEIPTLEVADIYECRVIKNIVKRYRERKYKVLNDKQNYREKEFPLIGAQIHFNNIQNRYPSHTSCNIHGFYVINDSVNEDKLIDAVNNTIKKHEVFGNKFFYKNGSVFQKYDKSYIKQVQLESVTEDWLNESFDNLIQPYDIFNEPLYRIRIFKTENGVYLFTDFHHLIMDGVSLDIFFRDITRAYDGFSLTKDNYYEYLYKKEMSERLNKDKKYELNTSYIMPFDFKKYQNIEYGIRQDLVEMSLNITNEKLESVCNNYKMSANSLFLGCYFLAMYKQIKQKSLCVSWIYNGRDSLLTEDSIGLMINLLFVNCDIDENMTISEYMNYIKKGVDESLSRSSYNGYAIRNLLDDPIGCFQYQSFEECKFTDIINKRIELPNPLFEPAFFWEVEVVNEIEDVMVRCIYNNNYYKNETADLFVENYKNAVNSIVNGKGKIKDV